MALGELGHLYLQAGASWRQISLAKSALLGQDGKVTLRSSSVNSHKHHPSQNRTIKTEKRYGKRRKRKRKKVGVDPAFCTDSPDEVGEHEASQFGFR